MKRNYNDGDVGAQRLGASSHESLGARLQDLWKACRELDLEKVKVILDSGVVNTSDCLPGRWKTIFHHAFLYRASHRKVLELLLTYPLSRLDPLLMVKLSVKWEPGATESFRMLLARQRLFSMENPDFTSVLHNLPFNADQEIVSLFVAAGADVNSPDRDGHTPLHAAVGLSDFRIPLVRSLLAAGARTDLHNSYGWLPLHGPNLSVYDLEDLLAYGADVHSRGADNTTALHKAVGRLGRNSVRRVAVLIDAGADTEARLYDGATVLFSLFRNLREPDIRDMCDVLEYLLRSGANLLARNHKRQPAFEIGVASFMQCFRAAEEDFRELANVGLEMIGLFIAYGLTESQLREVSEREGMRQVLDDAFTSGTQTAYQAARSAMLRKLY